MWKTTTQSLSPFPENETIVKLDPIYNVLCSHYLNGIDRDQYQSFFHVELSSNYETSKIGINYLDIKVGKK